MTYEELRESNALYLTAKEVGSALGFDAQALREQAKTDPTKLGFPVTVVGTRVKIPRLPLIAFLDGQVVADKEAHHG